MGISGNRFDRRGRVRPRRSNETLSFMFAMSEECTNPKYDGYRQTSDYKALAEGMKIQEEMGLVIDSMPHASETTLEEKTFFPEMNACGMVSPFLARGMSQWAEHN